MPLPEQDAEKPEKPTLLSVLLELWTRRRNCTAPGRRVVPNRFRSPLPDRQIQRPRVEADAIGRVEHFMAKRDVTALALGQRPLFGEAEVGGEQAVATQAIAVAGFARVRRDERGHGRRRVGEGARALRRVLISLCNGLRAGEFA